ncbi:cytochrome P450 [Dactylosporangium aurantiacum]|uniref:Cytochrome P450 n=1 Tax=Dactylosporangium aurantiacum TaxID=35754 RepID=A0A9Q9MKY2_9ACTN|nr:cytochrome P450 [Dactylosporangium aurantiacum]MDG6110028.1 cytochrome P450 [Dactylosporangium aurantiacum]UWZ58420.1 cytochrome P450 [Dactylosporangium aurantiacum]
MSTDAAVRSCPVALPTDRTDPFDLPPELAVLRAEAPVTRVELPAGGWAWLVTRHSDVARLLRDERLSADPTRPGFPFVRPGLRAAARAENRAGQFLRMDAPEHTRLRRLLTGDFMLREIRRLEPEITAMVDTLIDGLAGGEADLVSQFAFPLTSQVICRLLGVPYADHEQFQGRSRQLFSRRHSEADTQRFAAQLQAYMGALVDAKAAAEDPGDDLIGRLVRRHLRRGEVDRDEIVGIALLLLVAGHETTANMIGMAVLTLLEHPGQLARLRTDGGLAGAAVEELLRYHTIVHFGVPRVAVEELTVAGQTIRPGEGVLALLAAANRDPAVFADPDAFDIGREARHHLAFGFGAHQCLGQQLARAELRIALLGLLRRLPDLRLAVPARELSYRTDMATYGVHALPVRW